MLLKFNLLLKLNTLKNSIKFKDVKYITNIMVFIYVLKLANKKYYIGKTNDTNFRISEHFSKSGAEWTKIYKPLKVIEIISDCDDYDEDKYTRIYMDKYGIENVRGGSFSSTELDEETINILTKMSISTNDRCFKCGKCGHFAKQCKKIICYRCGRGGHYSTRCYAKCNISGNLIESSDESSDESFDSDLD